MARKSSADVGFLLAGGYSVLGQATMLDDERAAMIEDTTILGAAYQTSQFVGVKSWKLTQDGFYDDTALGHNVAFVEPGVSPVVAYAPEGNTIGLNFVGSPTVEASYKRQIARGALTKATVVFESAGNHDEGKILHALGTETATSGDTHTSSVDNGAASSNGGAGYVEITALTLGGYDNVVVKVNHSSDNSSFVALVTFTAVTAAPAAERKTVSGSVNRYLDASWAYGGSGSSPSVTFFAGFARG